MLQRLTCNPCTEDNNVSARWRDELGCSFPSCLPETPHQWMELVLHISKTRSIVLSLLEKIEKRRINLWAFSKHSRTADM